MQEAEPAENWFCLKGQTIQGSGQRAAVGGQAPALRGWEVPSAMVLGELLGSSPLSATGSSASWQLSELPTASHQSPLRCFCLEMVSDACN